MRRFFGTMVHMEIVFIALLVAFASAVGTVIVEEGIAAVPETFLRKPDPRQKENKKNPAIYIDRR